MGLTCGCYERLSSRNMHLYAITTSCPRTDRGCNVGVNPVTSTGRSETTRKPCVQLTRGRPFLLRENVRYGLAPDARLKPAQPRVSGVDSVSGRHRSRPQAGQASLATPVRWAPVRNCASLQNVVHVTRSGYRYLAGEGEFRTLLDYVTPAENIR